MTDLCKAWQRLKLASPVASGFEIIRAVAGGQREVTGARKFRVWVRWRSSMSSSQGQYEIAGALPVS